MNNPLKWMNRQLWIGRAALIAGLILAGLGVVLQGQVAGLAFNPRIVTGLGILLLGIAVAYLVRYNKTRHSPQVAARLANEEQDERTQLLRARAGSRAYWFSAVLTYALLMWVSFAENGGLPALSSDLLWYCLAGLVVLPIAVYAASLFIDEKQI